MKSNLTPIILLILIFAFALPSIAFSQDSKHKTASLVEDDQEPEDDDFNDEEPDDQNDDQQDDEADEEDDRPNRTDFGPIDAPSDLENLGKVGCGTVNGKFVAGQIKNDGKFHPFAYKLIALRRKFENTNDDDRAEALENKFFRIKRKSKRTKKQCGHNEGGGGDGGTSVPQPDGKFVIAEANPNFPSGKKLFTTALRGYLDDKVVCSVAVATGNDMNQAMHALHVCLEYLDPDEDGSCNVPAVCDSLNSRILNNNATLLYMRENQESNFDGWDMTQSVLTTDIKLNSLVNGNGSQQVFDFTLEEVLHWLTDNGWGPTFSNTFGSNNSSSWGQLVTAAIAGNQYDPTQTGDTRKDDIETTVPESLYWVITINLGLQEYDWRVPEIKAEWPNYSATLMQQNLPEMLNLVRDPSYGFTTTVPNGKYGPALQ
ncbi:MAG: hypothetical protein KDD62_01090 [Bdellovibrionales bacterium]|nr:hypothetical protein [Bdellovibrionales bacterium]